MEKPSIKDMSVKDLKKEIKELTSVVNSNINEYKAAGKRTKAFEQEIERLKEYGSKAPVTMRGVSEIGLGFRGKTKAQLQRQLGELRRVSERDVWTPAGARKITAAANQSWLSFKKNHEDWSKDKWRTFADTFGNLSDSLKLKFGYEITKADRKRTHKKRGKKVGNESLIMAFEDAYNKNVDLIPVMEKLERENRGKGLTQDEMIEKLMTEIKNL